MTCKDCIHYEFIKTNTSIYCLCSQAFNFQKELRYNQEAKCNYFKDKLHFVELPCKVGEKVFTKEEAEAKLKELKANEKNYS